MKAGKAFQLIERTCLIKNRGIHFHGLTRGVTPRTTTGGLFGQSGVRCRIRTQKELRRTGGCCGYQGFTVLLTLEDGQTVVVRSDPPFKQRIPVIQQMMGRNRRPDIAARATHKACRIRRRDVFEHDPQIRERMQQRF